MLNLTSYGLFLPNKFIFFALSDGGQVESALALAAWPPEGAKNET
jgi:hypothetical protein